MKTNYLAAKCGGRRAHWPSTAAPVGVANLVMYRILDRLKEGDVWVLRGMGTDLLILGLHSMDAIQAGQNRRASQPCNGLLSRDSRPPLRPATSIVRRPPLAQCARPLHMPPPAPAPAPAPSVVRLPVLSAHSRLLVRPLQWSRLSLAPLTQ